MEHERQQSEKLSHKLSRFFEFSCSSKKKLTSRTNSVDRFFEFSCSVDRYSKKKLTYGIVRSMLLWKEVVCAVAGEGQADNRKRRNSRFSRTYHETRIPLNPGHSKDKEQTMRSVSQDPVHKALPLVLTPIQDTRFSWADRTWAWVAANVFHAMQV